LSFWATAFVIVATRSVIVSDSLCHPDRSEGSQLTAAFLDLPRELRRDYPINFSALSPEQIACRHLFRD